MTAEQIALVGAGLGLVVNTLTILAVAWKGGFLLGTLNHAVESLTKQVEKLHEAVEKLAGLDSRVGRLERRDDSHR